MTIHAVSKHFYQLLIAVGFISLLAACGGSDGPKKDSTPNAITFAPVANAKVSTEVTSAPVTLSGFNQSVSISISGGSYSIGGTDFKTTAGTVTNGQVVTVKLTSSNKTNTATTATLTVGGVSGQFTVTTEADVTPDAFTFTPVTGAGAKAVTTSNEITVTGIDVAVPVSITNGEYKIGSGDFTNVAGTVNKDQKITVRTTSSDKPSTDVTAVLTIGGVAGNFVVTTIADEAAPTAQILFPPPVSMTEGNTILVRGSAGDEFSAIESVKVNGVVATTTDGFKNWQVLVPLADTTKFVTTTTENTLTVTTEDSAGNETADATHVAIRQAPLTSAFPDADGEIAPYTLALDQLDGRSRLLVASSSPNIYGVDLITGKRTLVTTFSDCTPDAIVINPINKHAYAPCGGSLGVMVDVDLANPSQYQTLANPNFDGTAYSQVFSTALELKDNTAKIAILYNKFQPFSVEFTKFDPTLSTFNVFSEATKLIPNANNPINESYGLAWDKARDRYLVTDFNQQIIFAVDAVTGSRSVFSSNAKGSGESFAEINNGILSGIAVDEINQRALVAEYYLSTKIFSIDLVAGNRSLLTSTSETNPFNSIYTGFDIKIANPKGYAFVAGYGDKAVFAVDLVTGQRVVFSKSVSVTH